jgi:hypothetical protein
MSYDLSLIIPGIRTQNWKMVYDSVVESCKGHTFELIFVGPFDPPPELASSPIKFFKTYMCPSSACQMVLKECTGKILNISADDARFLPGTVDLAMDLYNSLGNRKAIINMRYTEWANFSGMTYPPNHWLAHTHPSLQLAGIPTNYRIVMSPLMDYSYFMELGGLDCNYEVINFNMHDFIFRAQYDGCAIYESPTDINHCDHHPDRTSDHAPMHDAYFSDIVKFTDKYSKPNALNPGMVHINIDNWKYYAEPWGRRFKRDYVNYEEMMKEIS